MRNLAACALAVILTSVALTTGVFAAKPGSTHDMAGHGAMSCVGAACDTAPAAENVPSVECIAHCLQASSPATQSVPLAAATALALIAIIASWRKIVLELTSPGASDAIAAFARKRAVATVILRN